MNKSKSILIATGGTGGHVFPGLALAQVLRARGYTVTWLGTQRGIEAKVIPPTDIPFDTLQINGLRGKGLRSLLLAPWHLLRALWQTHRVLKKRKPDLVIGLGGFVSGPAGLMAYLSGIPLVVHEQNAIAGMTNRCLAHLARQVFSSFPDAFKPAAKIITTGNPVRAEIVSLPHPEIRFQDRTDALRILVLGGSLGATRLNELLPVALSLLDTPIQVWHQTGEATYTQTEQAYHALALDYRVSPFIDNMAQAYAWADLVICRAGATTIAELIAAGCASILIPYPHATDDHQTVNGQYLVRAQAALLLPQQTLTAEILAEKMRALAVRQHCLRMAIAARNLYQGDAVKQIADHCEDIINEQP